MDYTKSRLESRSILTQPVSPEQVSFPFAAQAARLLRQTDGRHDEPVALLTSAPPDQLNAQQWLDLNRQGFSGIENGLHQRLDVSQNDDRCRIRLSPGMFVMGLFRRFSNSLFMEWRAYQPHPQYQTTTLFQAAMAEDHCRPALRLVLAQHPSMRPP